MTRVILAAGLLPLLACQHAMGTWPWDQNMDDWRDRDGDGHADAARGGDDCEDFDASLYPGVISVEVGTEMAYVCDGTFTMGSPAEEVGSGTDEDQHEVTLTSAFFIGVYEVTQGDFYSLLLYLPSSSSGCPDCPVESLSWHEAAVYTNAMSHEAGLDPCYECSDFGSSSTCAPKGSPYACEGYRLPTEAEWERAARADTSSAFSNGGDLMDGDNSNCGGGLALENDTLLDDIAVYCGNDAGRSEEVGARDENPWGLYDLHGNVWEWCHDWYEEQAGAEEDPSGPASGSQRVRRGGSWSSYPQSLRSAERGSVEPSTTVDTLGFRVARTWWPTDE